MKFNIKVWRQRNAQEKGHFETYKIDNISPDSSFLEMLDILNDQLVHQNSDPIAFSKGCKDGEVCSGEQIAKAKANGALPISFDHDCREGICGACSLYINGRAHGPENEVTTCQLFMRKFKDGSTITIEPWRSAAFPVIKDLVVDRSALDKLMQAGGFVTIRTGSVQDANNIPISKEKADESMDAAACIGCGACVATCKNGSAMLFVGARVSSLALLPQGKVESERRAQNMIAKMEELGFGSCTNTRACEMECPKHVSISHIARLNREFLKGWLKK